MNKPILFPRKKDENLIKKKSKRTFSCLNISMEEQRVLVRKLMDGGLDFENAVKQKDKKIKSMKDFSNKIKKNNKYTEEEMNDLFLQEFEKICRQ